jgi:hypothetical protein
VPLSQFDQTVGLRLLSLHQMLYGLMGGWWGHRLGHVRMLLLRTTGRRSGQRRTSALFYYPDRDRLVVVGSKGGSDTAPAWLLNLQAEPERRGSGGNGTVPGSSPNRHAGGAATPLAGDDCDMAGL